MDNALFDRLVELREIFTRLNERLVGVLRRDGGSRFAGDGFEFGDDLDVVLAAALVDADFLDRLSAMCHKFPIKFRLRN